MSILPIRQRRRNTTGTYEEYVRGGYGEPLPNAPAPSPFEWEAGHLGPKGPVKSESVPMSGSSSSVFQTRPAPMDNYGINQDAWRSKPGGPTGPVGQSAPSDMRAALLALLGGQQSSPSVAMRSRVAPVLRSSFLGGLL